ncbi:cobalt-zinc-cadmium resistance protein CzcD [Cutibacterium acnes JCM 18909]|nr:cobalt-zinc-cadmium resistance protein CzcD [Cutibacterium acnes JCM 18909]
MITEIITAVISGSLALLSDAGHMLSDIGAIAIALWAARLTRRRPQGSWTWGWKRAEIMSAAVNGVTLLVVAILVGIELFDAWSLPLPLAEGWLWSLPL